MRIALIAWVFLKKIFALVWAFMTRKKIQPTPVKDEKPMEKKSVEEKQVWDKKDLLKPIPHNRYLTMYCISDLDSGFVELKDSSGHTIASISEHSKKRLDMEGTGRLSDGRVLNVHQHTSKGWNYVQMGSESPNGVGIMNKALEPWVSLAANLNQIRNFDLFDRKVVIPSMVGFPIPGGVGLEHTGIFRIHDTGGAMQPCPFYNGLWRSGQTKDSCGQFDVFVGDESIYNKLLSSWKDQREVIVMPRDTVSWSGIQETINLLMDAGLAVDGVFGPNTKGGICSLQEKAGLEPTGEWDKLTRHYAELSLDNWR